MKANIQMAIALILCNYELKKVGLDEAVAQVAGVVREYAKDNKFRIDGGDQFRVDFYAIDYVQVMTDWESGS